MDQIWTDLTSSPDVLTSTEAARRLTADGPNAILEIRRSAFVELLTHFRGAIPWMIEAALLLSLVAGHRLDAGIIGALLAMNGGAVAFWEEHRPATPSPRSRNDSPAPHSCDTA